ncbi:FecR family protein [Duncaniella freteri]|uniref:FecR family protein n=1 Tax=Duncaniella freteri TaxID=2530391 RepID=UPI0025582132|nr:FecR family protein [Duncaniella freteri]
MESVKRLLYRYMIGKCTSGELEELRRWAEGSPERQALLHRLADEDYITRQLARRELVRIERPMEDMSRRISASRRRLWSRFVSVAAVVAVVIGIGAACHIYNVGDGISLSTGNAPMAEADDSVKVRRLDEILPGSVRARLTSTSGSAVTLRAQDTSQVGNRILLSHNCPVDRVPELCLDVPRGGEFKVVLEDSTEVWLNSESTLRYPEVFSPGERRVQVTGEAYFVVKHDVSRPFYVETPEQTIRVYGTSFNVRAYADDPIVYTTLEEGSISLTRRDFHSGEVMLSPGHQAMLDRNNPKVEMKVVDPSVITGWRNGRFVFEEQPLASIMRDLSRWYDITYEFAETELENIVFMGSIPRYADFATAISIIEKSGGLKFITHGDKVLITRQL